MVRKNIRKKYYYRKVHGKRIRCRMPRNKGGVWVDISYPSGYPLKLYIPKRIYDDMETSFYEVFPDGDFDLDYCDIRVTSWNGVFKVATVSYYGEWYYNLPFHLVERNGKPIYAVAVNRIIR